MKALPLAMLLKETSQADVVLKIRGVWANVTAVVPTDLNPDSITLETDAAEPLVPGLADELRVKADEIRAASGDEEVAVLLHRAADEIERQGLAMVVL